MLSFRDDEAIWLKVYAYLREKILNGEICANARLVEATIAKEIGTSRTPVREALHNMQREGLVQSIPRIGYVVTSINEEEIAQICRIRALLEIQATEWAMQKQKRVLVRELKKNVSASEARVAKGDLANFISLDEQFHETIARLSGSNYILEIAKAARQHMLRPRMKSLLHSDAAMRALEGHKLILRTIQRGEADEVRKAIESHLEVALRDIRRSALLPDRT